MIQLYYSQAFPHLLYGITIWGTNNYQATYMHPIHKMQKKILRTIARLPPRTHTKPILTKYKILNIFNLYIQRVGLELHPYIHPTKPTKRPAHQHIYTPLSNIHHHNTRAAHQNNHYIPHAYNQQNQGNQPAHLTLQYTKIWNTLPTNLTNETNYTSFKNKLKEHLLEKQENEL